MWNLMFIKNSSPNWVLKTLYKAAFLWQFLEASEFWKSFITSRDFLTDIKMWTWTLTKSCITPHISIDSLQCGFSDDTQDVTSGWSPYNILHRCKVSPQCGPSDVCENVRPDWSPYHTADTCRVSLLCGPSDEHWAQHSNWILSHTPHI